MAAPVTRAVSLLVNAGIQTALAMSTVTTPEFIQEWRWEGWTTGNETANGGAVDFDNNVIIVGGYGFAAMLNEEDDTFTETYASDFGAVKLLGSSGEVVWTWTASSADDEADVLFTVDTDSNSDIIMGGYSEGVWAASNPHTVRHLVVVKLDGSTGEELWRYQEASQDSTSATITYYGSGTVIGLAVDGDDNVILVGQTYNSLVDGEGDPGDSDYFALKLDGTDGGEVWRMQGGFSFHFDSFLSVKVDSAGDVVAVGITGSEGVTDFLAVKLGGTDGSFLWEYSPYSSTIDVLHAVDFDGEDNLFVAGGEDAPSLLGQVAETPIVIKLNGTTGDVMWAYEGTAISRTVFLSVAVDPTTGWVVGAGITEGTWVTGDAQGNYDFAAVVLDGDTGDELGRYQNGTTGVDSIKFAEFDSVGALFFGGYSLDVSGDQDFVAIKLAPLDSIPLTPAPLLLSSTPVPTSAFLTPTSNPESPTQAPEAPGTSSPISANTPSPSAAAPTPAPTSEEAGAPALAQWEVGAIAAGGSLLLLLLALCGYHTAHIGCSCVVFSFPLVGKRFVCYIYL